MHCIWWTRWDDEETLITWITCESELKFNWNYFRFLFFLLLLRLCCGCCASRQVSDDTRMYSSSTRNIRLLIITFSDAQFSLFCHNFFFLFLVCVCMLVSSITSFYLNCVWSQQSSALPSDLRENLFSPDLLRCTITFMGKISGIPCILRHHSPFVALHIPQLAHSTQRAQKT